MRTIAIRASGTVEEQTWDAQFFHRWRLAQIDGIRRTGRELDFAAAIWAPDEEQQPGINHLGAEIAERLARPSEAARFRGPRNGDMLITGHDRSGLSRAQADFILAEVEDIFSPLVSQEGTGVRTAA